MYKLLYLKINGKYIMAQRLYKNANFFTIYFLATPLFFFRTYFPSDFWQKKACFYHKMLHFDMQVRKPTADQKPFYCR